MNYRATLNTVFSEVRSICRHVLQAYDRMNSPNTSKEDKARFIQNIDQTIQDEIISALKNMYPHHLFVAEEKSEASRQTLPDHPAFWVIDPIDGSHNYMHHIPYFSISLCFYEEGKPVLALVYNPLQDELFTAIKGNGALLNQHRIQVSRCKSINQIMCGIETTIGQNLPVLSHDYNIRQLGCTSLTLCYLACGRFDLAICQSPHIWDCAAGMLIAQESGALLYDSAFEPYKDGAEYLYASNKFIRDAINEC